MIVDKNASKGLGLAAEFVRRQHAAGVSYTEIGKALGVTATTASGIGRHRSARVLPVDLEIAIGTVGTS